MLNNCLIFLFFFLVVLLKKMPFKLTQLYAKKKYAQLWYSGMLKKIWVLFLVKIAIKIIFS